MRRTLSLRSPSKLGVVFIFFLAWLIAAPAWAATADEPTPFRPKNPKGVAREAFLEEFPEGEGESELLLRDASFISARTAGDKQLSVQQAGKYRNEAAQDTANRKNQAAARTVADALGAYGGAWENLGPNPIVQVSRANNLVAMSGRIGALAIRSSEPHTIILGGARGGIWTYDRSTGLWTAHTDDLAATSIGALAIAPSNEDIVYAGTGEGELSGDSYFGNGVLKSTDGGFTWSHVSGSSFQGVSISSLKVDPGNTDHLFVAVLRGRSGERRVSPPNPTSFGIWESTDGGVNWTQKQAAPNGSLGATDLDMDPVTPNVLYSTFWSDAVYKSTDGGATWSAIMTGLPSNADYAAGLTRFSMGLSHPAGGSAVLYLGFDYVDVRGNHHESRIWKSTNEGASWTLTAPGAGVDAVRDYCAEQCFYDNEVEVDPTNPNIVYVGGQFNYGIGSGGIYRSMDGGRHWTNLGYDQHPDFHAIAIRASDPNEVMIGNDGGVWISESKGGRLRKSDPLSAVTWEDLNGTVDPASGAVLGRSGLEITQFTSMANVPSIPARIWGGTQDNGTLRKSALSNSWFDLPSGDGGQVLVDPNNPNYVFGTYFGISPYRFSDGGFQFFGNEGIANGIDPTDRADFYPPWVMKPGNANQLFLGTYRLYRTNNAETPAAGDVFWNAISPDLTSGCEGTAPTGARGCLLGAVGVNEGGRGVYTGSLDGLVYFSPDAVNAATPTWTRVDKAPLPNRPVADFALDKSNDRIAYVAFNGFDAATPSTPGHVFKTTDAGGTWTDVTGNLPDAPVNSLQLDPSAPDTIYAGTEVGPYVTYDGGSTWNVLGAGFPIVSIWELALDPSNRNLRAGTHGRGAWSVSDATTRIPALVATTSEPGIPVGPGSELTFTFTVRNIGNGSARGVGITDPIPAHTSFVSASDGGVLNGGSVEWGRFTIPAGGSLPVTLTVKIDDPLPSGVEEIVNDGLTVSASNHIGTTGSRWVVPIAPPHAVTISPASQTNGTKVGSSVDYHVTVRNGGFLSDSYGMSASGNAFPTSFLDATCTSTLATTATLAPGETTDVCVRVAVPAGTANGTVDDATITATSTADPSVSGTAALHTIAVDAQVLLVDNDNNDPDVESFYTDALTSAGVTFTNWDIIDNPVLPESLMQAHPAIVWFTGASYPGPVTPYEDELASYLDAGGHLFMTGDDILDQAAGTSAFVHDYLHIDWDGSEVQNDITTGNVHGVPGNPVTDGIGTVPLDISVLGGVNFSDQITPIAPAVSAFTDDATKPDALTLDTGAFKVVFLAFPFEEYGSATQKVDLVNRVLSYFGV